MTSHANKCRAEPIRHTRPPRRSSRGDDQTFELNVNRERLGSYEANVALRCGVAATDVNCAVGRRRSRELQVDLSLNRCNRLSTGTSVTRMSVM
jgi:hypothetical protein